jgi:hypothetical protein
MTEKQKSTGLDLLREPFPPHQISKLPKPFKKDSPKGKCQECGGYHGLPAMHLDYVGHAALTDRLLDCDPSWTWEPVAFGPDGLPAMDRIGGLWIRLTVCGQTRLGYGHADGKQGGDAIKEAIGDAMRNAAMRFGAALDLWHKGDLHGDDDAQDPAPRQDTLPPKADKPPPTPAQIADKLIKRFGEMETLKALLDFTEPDTASGKAWDDLAKNHGKEADRVKAAFDKRKSELEG